MANKPFDPRIWSDAIMEQFSAQSLSITTYMMDLAAREQIVNELKPLGLLAGFDIELHKDEERRQSYISFHEPEANHFTVYAGCGMKDARELLARLAAQRFVPKT